MFVVVVSTLTFYWYTTYLFHAISSSMSSTGKLLGLEIQKTKQKILGITSHPFEILGQINASIFYKGDITISQLLVCRNVDIIGLDILKIVYPKLIVHLSGSVGTTTLLSRSNLISLIEKISNLLGGMKITPIQIQHNNSQPIFLKNCAIAYGLRDSVKSCLDRMVESAIVKRL